MPQATMRAMVLERPGPPGGRPLRARRVPRPVPAPGQVVLAVEACAVCRTDLQIATGDLAARRLPVIPGHQVVGRVAATGAGVRGWAPGDRAGAFWLAGACGRCRRCTEGRENLCPQASMRGWDVDGGYAEAMAADAAFVVRLPEAPAAAALAPLLCAGVIGLRALRLSGAGAGDAVGLFGFGASARQALQVARRRGSRVLAFARGAGDRRRALELGAEWAGAMGEQPPVALDAAVTFAPVGEAVVHALRALAPGGTVAVNAIHLDRIPEFPYALLWGERGVRSVANLTRADAAEFVALAAAEPIVVDHVTYPLEAAGDALADLAAGRIAGSAVLVP